MERWTPRSCRRWITSPARTGSAMIALSVISSRSRSAGTPVRLRARRTVSGRVLSSRQRAEMFTDTTSGVPATAQRAAWSSDRFSTWVVSSWMNSTALGERDERVRGQQPLDRVLPAHEGLDAEDSAAEQVHRRLVVHHELVVGDRAAQLEQQDQLTQVVLVQAGVVAREHRVVLLRDVHGDVGALHQLLDIGCRPGGTPRSRRCPRPSATAHRRGTVG